MTGITFLSGRQQSGPAGGTAGARATEQAIASFGFDDFEPNPLNPYQQVAYHFRMFVTGEKDLYTGARDPTDINALLAQIETQPKVIVAESGVTGFNIRDVEIVNIVGPGIRTHNTQGVSLVITIVEPLGTSFLDALQSAAVAMGVRNYRDMGSVYLELTFRGFDEGGNYATSGMPSSGSVGVGGRFVPISMPGYRNGGRWVWQMNITNIRVQFDATGSVYTIEAIPTTGAGANPVEDHDARIPEAISIYADKLGEFFDQFERKLNEDVKLRNGGQVVEYKFVLNEVRPLGRNETLNPRDFSLVPQHEDVNPRRSFSLVRQQGRKPQAQFSPGMRITEVIELMIANTDKARDLALDIEGAQDRVTWTDTRVNSRGVRESTLFRVELDTEITGYDQVSNRYVRRYTYHISPSYHLQTAPPSPIDVDNARTPEAQTLMRERLKTGNFLRKRYDYLFTGLNTEVIDLKIDYKFTWNVLVPQMGGAQANIDAVSPHARLSRASRSPQYNLPENQNHVQSSVDPLREAQQQASALQASLQQATSQRRAAAQALSRPPGGAGQGAMMQLATLFEEAVERERIISAQLEAARTRLDELSRGGAQLQEARLSRDVYAEDILGPVQSDEGNLPITFLQGGPRLGAPTDTSLSTERYGDRSVFGAILNQMYNTVPLQVVEMTIRGDPYWLGMGTLERQIVVRARARSAGAQGQPPQAGQAGQQAQQGQRGQQQAAAGAQGAGQQGGAGDGSGLPDWTTGDHTFLLYFRYPFGLAADDSGPQFFDHDVFRGVYAVKRVRNTFSDGVFKQTLEANRLPLIQLARSTGVSETPQSGGGSLPG